MGKKRGAQINHHKVGVKKKLWGELLPPMHFQNAVSERGVRETPYIYFTYL
jgi:hypothetical protein